jgi:hypothetical protein
MWAHSVDINTACGHVTHYINPWWWRRITAGGGLIKNYVILFRFCESIPVPTIHSMRRSRVVRDMKHTQRRRGTSPPWDIDFKTQNATTQQLPALNSNRGTVPPRRFFVMQLYQENKITGEWHCHANHVHWWLLHKICSWLYELIIRVIATYESLHIRLSHWQLHNPTDRWRLLSTGICLCVVLHMVTEISELHAVSMFSVDVQYGSNTSFEAWTPIWPATWRSHTPYVVNLHTHCHLESHR